jgi:hypothetical protein
MVSSLRIIVSGLSHNIPLGSDLGLLPVRPWPERIGHDVYYLEDTGQWPYNPYVGVSGCEFNVNIWPGSWRGTGCLTSGRIGFPGSHSGSVCLRRSVRK